MSEYIEREAVIEIILGLTIVGPDVAQYANAVCYILQDFPAADVAPVRHGRWIFKHPNGWACSLCGEWGLMIDNRGICKSNYCPNCGALMHGKEDEHEAG